MQNQCPTTKAVEFPIHSAVAAYTFKVFIFKNQFGMRAARPSANALSMTARTKIFLRMHGFRRFYKTFTKTGRAAFDAAPLGRTQKFAPIYPGWPQIYHPSRLAYLVLH
jgi:hypothetical protein